MHTSILLTRWLQMARKRAGLGRGLAELLGEGVDGSTGSVEEGSAELGGDGQEASSAGQVVDVEVTAVRANPRQPRRSMDVESLEELARSIEATGMVQPVIVLSLIHISEPTRRTPISY